MADSSGHSEDRALNFGLFGTVSTSVHAWEFFSSLFYLSSTLFLLCMRIFCIHVLVFQETLPGILRSRQVFKAQPGPILFEKCLRFSGLSLFDSE